MSFFFIAIYFGINIQSILINQLFIKLNMYILANNETFYYDILYIKHRKINTLYFTQIFFKIIN